MNNAEAKSHCKALGRFAGLKNKSVHLTNDQWLSNSAEETEVVLKTSRRNVKANDIA